MECVGDEGKLNKCVFDVDDAKLVTNLVISPHTTYDSIMSDRREILFQSSSTNWKY